MFVCSLPALLSHASSSSETDGPPLKGEPRTLELPPTTSISVPHPHASSDVVLALVPHLPPPTHHSVRPGTPVREAFLPPWWRPLGKLPSDPLASDQLAPAGSGPGGTGRGPGRAGLDPLSDHRVAGVIQVDTVPRGVLRLDRAVGCGQRVP